MLRSDAIWQRVTPHFCSAGLGTPQARTPLVLRRKAYRGLRRKSIRLLVRFILLAFLVSCNLSAQVIIKERMEITAKSKATPLVAMTQQQPHTVIFRVSWDNPNQNFIVALYLEFGPYHQCGDTVVPGLSPQIECTIVNPRMLDYGMCAQIWTVPGGDSSMMTYTILDNGIVIDEVTFMARSSDVSDASHKLPTVSRYVPLTGYCTTFALAPQAAQIQHGFTRSLGINPGQTCSYTPMWHPAWDSVTFTIIHGQEYGVFREWGGPSFGSTLTVLAADLIHYSYVADGIEPDPNGSKVVIQASAQSIVKQDSFTVTRGFFISAVPDSIAYGDTTNLWVTSANPFSPDDYVSFSVDSTRFGSFIDTSGNMWPSPFSVPFSQTSNGRIRFVANGFVDTVSLKRISISVSRDESDGRCDLFLSRIKVEISPRDTALYPTYPGQNDQTSKKNFVDFQIRTTSRGRAAKFKTVRIDSTTVVDIGGHSHGGRRRLGLFLLERAQDTTTYDSVLSVNRATDATGVLRVRFLASQFGGVERIKPKLSIDTTSFDTVRVKTRVPRLALLGVGTHYIKVGGRCEHHGPGGSGDCSTPDTDHYGDSTLLALIPIVADSFALLYPQVNLWVNDMSLPYGGKFDISGDWLNNSKNHAEHREGTNADFPLTYLNSLVAEDDLWALIRSLIGEDAVDERLETIHGVKVRSSHPHFHARAQ